MEEQLSLATFEPDRAYPPYLNTPRSLEACRLNGINPIELVEIPIAEFQKDFPNDPDATQRRYERIDGARKRVLAAVKKDWKKLVQSEWQPSPTRPKNQKESILNVAPEAHCTLLEIQAARFRKIEEDNWIALQRQLKIQLKKADQEVKNKKIEQKHEEIKASNDEQRKMLLVKREMLMKEQLEKQKREEEERMHELRQLQEMDAEYAKQKHQAMVERQAREKQMRERREAERVQRQEYTKKVKDSIVNGVENKIKAKKKIQEMRDKSLEDRLNEAREMKDRELREKREQLNKKLQRAREEAAKREQDSRDETLAKIIENEKYRSKIAEAKDSQKKELNEISGDRVAEKMLHIQKEKDRITQEKAEKTLRELELKEQMSKQAMDKVKEAQEKRRTIKAIRQESFEIAALRRQKQEEYRKAKLEKELKDKEDRCNAIKKGFVTLNQMRNSMRDIMIKTNLEMKETLHQLKHHDEFQPEKVIDSALEVSRNVLFPKLKNTFGFQSEQGPSSPVATAGFTGGGGHAAGAGTAASSGLFISQPGDGEDDTGSAASENGSAEFPHPTYSQTQTHTQRSAVSSPGAGGQLTGSGVRSPSSRKSPDRLRSARKRGAGGPQHSSSASDLHLHDISDPTKLSRIGFATMASSLSVDQLRQSLNASKERLDHTVDPFDPRARSKSGQRRGGGKKTRASSSGPLYSSRSGNGTGTGTGRRGEEEEEDDDERINMRPITTDDSSSPHGARAGGREDAGAASVSASAGWSSRRKSNKSAGSSPGRGGKGAGKGTHGSLSRGSSAKGRNKNNNTNSNSNSKQSAPQHVRLQDDMELPVVEFKPAGAVHDDNNDDDDVNDADDGGESGEKNGESEEKARSAAASIHSGSGGGGGGDNNSVRTDDRSYDEYDPYGKRFIKHPDPSEKHRTDVNVKAKFAETPPGQFRREFSTDHPLAKGGTGRYEKELKDGIVPVGIELPIRPKSGKEGGNDEQKRQLKTQKVEETLAVAEKIEKLTFSAEKKVVDPRSLLESLKKAQNEALLRVLEEEQQAEEERVQLGRTVTDEAEKVQIEAVFAEERKRASERILSVTREHELAMKDAVLGMMNLGGGRKSS